MIAIADEPLKPTLFPELDVPEYKITRLRDCPVNTPLLDTPQRFYEFWTEHIERSAGYREGVENLAVVFMNTRKRVTGFTVVSTGTLDTILVHPREVFRAAIIKNSAAIIVGHNHPSGDPTPSEADIKVTRELVRAGQVIKIDLVDHVVIGRPDPSFGPNGRGFMSLRELGYFL